MSNPARCRCAPGSILRKVPICRRRRATGSDRRVAHPPRLRRRHCELGPGTSPAGRSRRPGSPVSPVGVTTDPEPAGGSRGGAEALAAADGRVSGRWRGGSGGEGRLAADGDVGRLQQRRAGSLRSAARGRATGGGRRASAPAWIPPRRAVVPIGLGVDRA